jgi:plasmid stability protein
MMNKPRLIEWLEAETGQRLDLTAPKSRHVSIRVPDDLYARLEILAGANGETVSRCARRILESGLTSERGPATAIDDAIATLQRVRAELDEQA